MSSSPSERRETTRDAATTADARNQPASLWWTRRAIGLHAALAVALPGFLALGWWQLQRALGGNGLSWAYTFEWPFFAGYALYVWWRLIHEDAPTPARVRRLRSALHHRAHDRRDEGESDDEALARYNAHLATLRAFELEKEKSRQNLA